MRVATREGSARGHLDGTVRNGAAEAVCPSKAVPGVVGSGAVVSPQTTPPLAREVRPESSPHATTLGRGRSPNRPEERRKRVQVQVVPRITKRILEDGLGIRDKRAIQGQFRIEACRKKVDRRIAPNAKQ